jgi:hypothetical protein
MNILLVGLGAGLVALGIMEKPTKKKAVESEAPKPAPISTVIDPTIVQPKTTKKAPIKDDENNSSDGVATD